MLYACGAQAAPQTLHGTFQRGQRAAVHAEQARRNAQQLEVRLNDRTAQAAARQQAAGEQRQTKAARHGQHVERVRSSVAAAYKAGASRAEIAATNAAGAAT